MIRLSLKLTAKDWAYIDDALSCQCEFWGDEASDKFAKELLARLRKTLADGERIVIDRVDVSTDEKENRKLLPKLPY